MMKIMRQTVKAWLVFQGQEFCGAFATADEARNVVDRVTAVCETPVPYLCCRELNHRQLEDTIGDDVDDEMWDRWVAYSSVPSDEDPPSYRDMMEEG